MSRTSTGVGSAYSGSLSFHAAGVPFVTVRTLTMPR